MVFTFRRTHLKMNPSADLGHALPKGSVGLLKNKFPLFHSQQQEEKKGRSLLQFFPFFHSFLSLSGLGQQIGGEMRT
jgi:hypothetical protein